MYTKVGVVHFVTVTIRMLFFHTQAILRNTWQIYQNTPDNQLTLDINDSHQELSTWKFTVLLSRDVPTPSGTHSLTNKKMAFKKFVFENNLPDAFKSI
jgi:hypothetical protein